MKHKPMLGNKDTLDFLEHLPVEDTETMERALNRIRYNITPVPVRRMNAVIGKGYSRYFCGNCNLEVQLQDYYCSRCGKAISWDIPR